MPVSKRRKKKPPRRSRGHGNVQFFEHPFSRIPRDALLKGLADVGKRQSEEFPKLLTEIQKTIDGVDALQAIATMSTYGLMGGLTESGERRSFLGEGFNQSHVELSQALA